MHLGEAPTSLPSCLCCQVKHPTLMVLDKGGPWCCRKHFLRHFLAQRIRNEMYLAQWIRNQT